jgi:hypothetical protein
MARATLSIVEPGASAGIHKLAVYGTPRSVLS